MSLFVRRTTKLSTPFCPTNNQTFCGANVKYASEASLFAKKKHVSQTHGWAVTPLSHPRPLSQNSPPLPPSPMDYFPLNHILKTAPPANQPVLHNFPGKV